MLVSIKSISSALREWYTFEYFVKAARLVWKLSRTFCFNSSNSRYHAHYAPMGNWPWHCTSTGQGGSNGLELKWIGPLVAQLWHLQVLDGGTDGRTDERTNGRRAFRSPTFSFEKCRGAINLGRKIKCVCIHPIKVRHLLLRLTVLNLIGIRRVPCCAFQKITGWDSFITWKAIQGCNSIYWTRFDINWLIHC